MNRCVHFHIADEASITTRILKHPTFQRTRAKSSVVIFSQKILSKILFLCLFCNHCLFGLVHLVSQSIEDLNKCQHMLVYLTNETWRGEDSAQFAAEVEQAMDEAVHLLLAHEMPGLQEEERHAVDFGDFFIFADQFGKEAKLP